MTGSLSLPRRGIPVGVVGGPGKCKSFQKSRIQLLDEAFHLNGTFKIPYISKIKIEKIDWNREELLDINRQEYENQVESLRDNIKWVCVQFFWLKSQFPLSKKLNTKWFFDYVEEINFKSTENRAIGNNDNILLSHNILFSAEIMQKMLWVS